MMFNQSILIEWAKQCGASTAELRGVVVDVFFEPRDLAQFANRVVEEFKKELTK
jgi:hypothetical protein